MDIKVFVKEEQGFEQWDPRMKGSFPMPAEMIRNQVFPAFSVAPPVLARDDYTLQQFLDEIVRPHPNLAAVDVFKRRFGFTVNGCITEHAEVWFNNAGLQTVAVESVDIEALISAKEMLGLHEYQNVNYLRAIKQVVGMESSPSTPST